MLKTSFLKGIFLTAFLLTALLLLYIYYFVHPAYHRLLVQDTENEAVRYVSYLVRAFDLKEIPIETGSIPAQIAEDVGRFGMNEPLIKLRVFDSAGKIVYSTLFKEIGRINEYDYFHQQVATGQVFTKAVRKDQLTAEMEILKKDLIETYVPIMADGRFRGAVETYYDVTGSVLAINHLTMKSLASLSVVAFFLLTFLYYALQRTDYSIIARVHAENELRKSNEELEARVASRTADLVELNNSLNEEIAEKNLAQAALSTALSDMEKARDKIDGIIRSVNDGLLVVDQAGKIVLMNRAAEEISGVTMETVSGKSIHEIPISDSLRKVLDSVVAKPDMARVDFEQAREKPARLKVFQARSSVLRDRDNSSLGAVILMHDVTIEREIEQVKLDFLAMAAHELMTPLASIMGYAELLSSETAKQLTEEQKAEFIHYIFHKAEGLSRIVDDLLDISRIESGQQISISKKEFNLSEIMDKLVTVYSKADTAHQFVVDSSCRDCRVCADPVRIEQVLENLLSNAVKYSPEGGEIRLACAMEKGICSFEVSDQGIGMTPDQIEHVFEKFYRADEGNTARQGVGLGMSIARYIIEAHGGDIGVTSEPGVGTTVVFSVPTKAAQTKKTEGEGQDVASV